MSSRWELEVLREASTFGWILGPVYGKVADIIKAALGAQAKGLLKKVKALWKDIERGVDAMLLEAVSELVCDSNLPGLPDPDHWDDQDGVRRSGMSIPLPDFADLVIFRAFTIGSKKTGTDPWLTLKQFGMTPQVQTDVISAIARNRIPKILEARIGEVISECGVLKHVLVDVRPEAYEELEGTPQLVKVAAMHGKDKGDPAVTKKIFDKKVNYSRGKYNKDSFRSRLPKGKFY